MGVAMNKPGLAAASLAALITIDGNANAAVHNPPIVWQGGAEIVALTSPACDNKDLRVGDLAHSVYRPRLDPAEPESALTLVFTRSGQIYIRGGGTSTDQMNGTTNYQGWWFGNRAFGKGSALGILKLKISPTPVLDTETRPIIISGTITNFYGIAGCTATIKGAYQRRP
jgi:hypothetical protein